MASIDYSEKIPNNVDLAADKALAGYHLLPSVRGDLLAKAGRSEEAAAEFRRAAEMTGNLRERDLLLRRAARPGG